MNITQLQKYAKDHGFDSVRFEFTNRNGANIQCQWLDAYYGLFKMGDNEGFVTVSQWQELTNDLFDLRVIESEPPTS